MNQYTQTIVSMNRRHRQSRLSRRRAHRGMTLVEILFALIILLIGLTAIASIFPLAAHVQNKAFNEIIADHVARNAEAMIKARGFSQAALSHPDYGPADSHYGRYHFQEGEEGYRRADPSGKPFPIGGDLCWWNPDGDDGSWIPVPPVERWHLEDRSYPSAVANPADREFFWVPLLRDQNTTLYHWDMIAYVFVMKGDNNADYGLGGPVNWNDPRSVPKIFEYRSANTDDLDFLRVGSWVMSQQYPTTITYADDNPNALVHAGNISSIPEAQPGSKRYGYNNNDGVRYAWAVPSSGKNNSNRRETPLLRIHMVGGEFLRK